MKAARFAITITTTTTTVAARLKKKIDNNKYLWLEYAVHQ